MTAATWRGRPAIVVRGRRVTPAEGLTPEKRDWRVDAYDERGAWIGGVDLPPVEGASPDAAVVDGWLVTPARDRGSRAVHVAAGREAPTRA
ncbi:hypothetical protein ACFZBU_38425 [Embleya sp. NPDC008237]|uniref:hypothetical protein n=1 Tax=Embleya sp. NPDC008237 TaxID=3363978 RepID=UPI0036E2A08C